jgi:hypothetical protein
VPQSFRVRELSDNDLKSAVNLIAYIVVNEFNFQLKLDGFDSDLLHLKQHYNKNNGGCFWVVERVDTTGNYQIVGTVAIRNLSQFVSTCELGR